MAHEVELKLTLPEFAVEAFLASPNLGESQGEPLQLDNQYFDTDDLALNQSHAALRIRKSQFGYKQTLKNKGQAMAGLHQRGEWEYDIDEPQINWSLFPAELNIAHDLQSAIKPIFKTDFTRHVWIKQQANSEIELVLDQGRISDAGHNIALCEIELELKSGKVDDLFTFAQDLAEHHPLVPCDINKAERGYGLSHPQINFFTAADFSNEYRADFDLLNFMQETLTRISRGWDEFGQKDNWWSLIVLSRQIHALSFTLNGMSVEASLIQKWKALSDDIVELLKPARVVLALHVDDHSNSRGLSQRLLQNLTAQSSDKIHAWVEKNILGQAMLELGEYLYKHGDELSLQDKVEENKKEQLQPSQHIWKEINVLMEQAIEMPVQELQDLNSIQALAYYFKRFQHSAYSACNLLIKQHLVVLGMADAMDISVVKDDSSRAKLASWSRRITVEQRRLQQAREQLKDLLFSSGDLA